MKILFVAPYIPSPIRVRPYRFLKGLAEKGHAITFVGLAGSYANAEDLEELKKNCCRTDILRIPKNLSYSQCVTQLTTGMPLQVAYCFSERFRHRVASIVSNEPFDVMHIEHVRAAYTLPTQRECPAVYDSVDCITALYKGFRQEQVSLLSRLVAWIESKKLEKYEPTLLQKFDTVLVSAQRDRQALETLCLRNKYIFPAIKVIENGVDSRFFRPLCKRFEPNAIVFTGKMGYPANELAVHHFVRDIFPLIKAKKPDAKFYIVGANPSKRIIRLQQKKDVIVTGWVRDIREYLERAHVVACPMRVSGGIQNKLLEAMAMAKPVVTYPGVSLPLPSHVSNVFLVADGPTEFANRVLDVLNTEELRRQLGENAREYVKHFYSWRHRIEQLENVYQALQ